jgi:hypothetical protein
MLPSVAPFMIIKFLQYRPQVKEKKETPLTESCSTITSTNRNSEETKRNKQKVLKTDHKRKVSPWKT